MQAGIIRSACIFVGVNNTAYMALCILRKKKRNDYKNVSAIC